MKCRTVWAGSRRPRVGRVENAPSTTSSRRHSITQALTQISLCVRVLSHCGTVSEQLMSLPALTTRLDRQLLPPVRLNTLDQHSGFRPQPSVFFSPLFSSLSPRRPSLLLASFQHIAALPWPVFSHPSGTILVFAIVFPSLCVRTCVRRLSATSLDR